MGHDRAYTVLLIVSYPPDPPSRHRDRLIEMLGQDLQKSYRLTGTPSPHKVKSLHGDPGSISPSQSNCMCNIVLGSSSFINDVEREAFGVLEILQSLFLKGNKELKRRDE
jgi:hypothetical protein